MLKKKFVEIQSKSNVFRNFTEKDMVNLKSSIQMLEAMSTQRSGSFVLAKDKQFKKDTKLPPLPLGKALGSPLKITGNTFK